MLTRARWRVAAAPNRREGPKTPQEGGLLLAIIGQRDPVILLFLGFPNLELERQGHADGARRDHLSRWLGRCNPKNGIRGFSVDGIVFIYIHTSST